MPILGRALLDAFVKEHADARAWVENWTAETENIRWRTPQDIKNMYASVSFLSENIVIFNVKGNRYRMETLVACRVGIVIVRWIGTHAEYDRRN